MNNTIQKIKFYIKENLILINIMDKEQYIIRIYNIKVNLNMVIQ